MQREPMMIQKRHPRRVELAPAIFAAVSGSGALGTTSLSAPSPETVSLMAGRESGRESAKVESASRRRSGR